MEKSSIGRFEIIRWVVGGILLIASALKSFELFQSPAPENYLLGSRIFTILLIEYEIILAGWILSGIYVNAARLAGIATFTVFAVASLFAGIRGETECHCFGFVEINPWVTLILDLVIVGVLVTGLTNKQSVLLKKPAAQINLIPALLLATWMALCFLLAKGPATVPFSEMDLGPGNSGIVVLEPNDWVGKRLPLLPYIETDQPIMEGEWNLVLFHYHCELCQTLIGKTKIHADGKTLFIEVPPCVDFEKTSSDVISWAKLSDARNWFVSAPVMIVVEDGRVIEVQSRDVIRESLHIP